MKTLKAAANAVFASLPYTHEQRIERAHDHRIAMRDAIKDACQFHLVALDREVNNFDEDNWLIGDECGKAVLVMKDLDNNPIDIGDYGQVEVMMKEGGEIRMRIHLDGIFTDGFEPVMLEAKDHALTELLVKMVERLTNIYEINGLALCYKGKNILVD